MRQAGTYRQASALMMMIGVASFLFAFGASPAGSTAAESETAPIPLPETSDAGCGITPDRTASVAWAGGRCHPARTSLPPPGIGAVRDSVVGLVVDSSASAMVVMMDPGLPLEESQRVSDELRAGTTLDLRFETACHGVAELQDARARLVDAAA